MFIIFLCVFPSIDDPQDTKQLKNELRARLGTAQDNLNSCRQQPQCLPPTEQRDSLGATNRMTSTALKADDMELVRAGLLCRNYSTEYASNISAADRTADDVMEEATKSVTAPSDDFMVADDHKAIKAVNDVRSTSLANTTLNTGGDANERAAVTSHASINAAHQEQLRQTDDAVAQIMKNNFPESASGGDGGGGEGAGQSLLQAVYGLWQQQLVQCHMLEVVRQNLLKLTAEKRRCPDLPGLDVQSLLQLQALYLAQQVHDGRQQVRDDRHQLHTSLDSDGRPMSSESCDSDVNVRENDVIYDEPDASVHHRELAEFDRAACESGTAMMSPTTTEVSAASVNPGLFAISSLSVSEKS